MVQHPEVLWAQRSSDSVPEKNVIYLTINLPEIDESTLEFSLTATELSFKAKAGALGETLKEYGFTFELYSEIVPEESSKRLSSRHMALTLRKKGLNTEYWPRLAKTKAKLAFIKTDFSKWVDEEEQDEVPAKDPEDDDMDMGGMGGMGGLGGMGGMGGMDMADLMKQMGTKAGDDENDEEITEGNNEEVDENNDEEVDEGNDEEDEGEGGPSANTDVDELDDEGPPPLEDESKSSA